MQFSWWLVSAKFSRRWTLVYGRSAGIGWAGEAAALCRVRERVFKRYFPRFIEHSWAYREQRSVVRERLRVPRDVEANISASSVARGLKSQSEWAVARAGSKAEAVKCDPAADFVCTAHAHCKQSLQRLRTSVAWISSQQLYGVGLEPRGNRWWRNRTRKRARWRILHQRNFQTRQQRRRSWGCPAVRTLRRQAQEVVRERFIDTDVVSSNDGLLHHFSRRSQWNAVHRVLASRPVTVRRGLLLSARLRGPLSPDGCAVDALNEMWRYEHRSPQPTAPYQVKLFRAATSQWRSALVMGNSAPYERRKLKYPAQKDKNTRTRRCWRRSGVEYRRAGGDFPRRNHRTGCDGEAPDDSLLAGAGHLRRAGGDEADGAEAGQAGVRLEQRGQLVEQRYQNGAAAAQRTQGWPSSGLIAGVRGKLVPRLCHVPVGREMKNSARISFAAASVLSQRRIKWTNSRAVSLLVSTCVKLDQENQFPASLKVEQRPWFSAQTFLNYRSFTSRKRIVERCAETLKF